MLKIDSIAYTSKLRNKNPAMKCLLAVGTLLICVWFRSIVLSIIVLLIMGYLTLLRGGISPCHYFKYMLVPEVFILLSIPPLLFDISSVYHENIFNLIILNRYFYITEFSLLDTLKTILTALSSISCLYFLILNTPFMEVLSVMKKIYIPSLIIELMLLIYRYIFILSDIANNIIKSQKCRLSEVSYKTRLTSMGQMLSSLLVISLKKSNVMYDAMESRLFDGTINILEDYPKANNVEIFFTIGYLLVLVMLGVIFQCNNL